MSAPTAGLGGRADLAGEGQIGADGPKETFGFHRAMPAYRAIGVSSVLAISQAEQMAWQQKKGSHVAEKSLYVFSLDIAVAAKIGSRRSLKLKWSQEPSGSQC